MKLKITDRTKLIKFLAKVEAEWIASDPETLEHYIIHGYQGLGSYSNDELLVLLDELSELPNVLDSAIEIGSVENLQS